MTRTSLARYGALVAAVAASATLITIGPRHSPFSIVLAGVATACCGAIAYLETRGPRLSTRVIVAAIGVVFAIAVAVPPRSSNDLWSYTMYGRIVTAHSANPYERSPADFPSDPVFRRVSPVWRHRPSVFGPVFVGFAVAGTELAGGSLLADRLYFQLAAAAAATAVLALVWSRTRSHAALAWLGLHPAFGALAINGGHIDVVVGLGILAGAVLAARRRAIAAGAVIALVALMKLTALLALLGLVLWAARHRDTRFVRRVVVAASAVVAFAYLPVVASASGVLARADRTVTPATIWNPLSDFVLGSDAGRGFAHPLAPNSTLTVLFYLSLVTVGVIAVVVGWHGARSSRPEPAVGAATASYTMASQYTFPWYAAWSLPTFAARPLSRLAWVVWLQAFFMVAALMLPVRSTGTIVDNLGRVALTYVAPVLLFVAFVVTATRTTEDAPASAVATVSP